VQKNVHNGNIRGGYFCFRMGLGLLEEVGYVLSAFCVDGVDIC
jgi:hypothetical protein